MPARTSAAEARDREARAIDLRRNGATYDQIADRLDISKSGAALAVKRALDRHVSEAAPDVRKLELDRLDQLFATALTVLARPHYFVQGGRIVHDDLGQPLRDDGPALAAVQTLLKVQERRARLLGLDAPAKHDVTVYSIDALDARIAELQAQLQANDGLPQPSRA